MRTSLRNYDFDPIRVGLYHRQRGTQRRYSLDSLNVFGGSRLSVTKRHERITLKALASSGPGLLQHWDPCRFQRYFLVLVMFGQHMEVSHPFTAVRSRVDYKTSSGDFELHNYRAVRLTVLPTICMVYFEPFMLPFINSTKRCSLA